jgi:thiol:disulfide interchange protein DsbD
MTRSNRLAACAGALAMPFLFLGVAFAAPAPGTVVTTPQVRAELVAQALEGLAPGKAVTLGLKIEHQPHWHTYWKNPGDSGLPTTLEWTLPAGVQAAGIQWPTPKKLPIGPLLNYGYEGTVLLPVALTLPADFKAEALDVKLHAEWLVCKDVCIPESGDFALRLPAQAATAGHTALFAAATAAQPQDLPQAQAAVTFDGAAMVVRVSGLPAAWQGRAMSLLPETAGLIQTAAPQQNRWADGAWTARVALDPQRSAAPATLAAVLIADGQPAGLRLQTAITTAWPAAAPAPAALPALVTPSATSSTAPEVPASLGLALLLALAGGALLNLMPCVFPVLSLKVLGFARHADDRRALLVGGLAYTAGVVASFVALAALLLALRAGGEQLGWGFQLQTPAVVAVLAALFTLIGLNLAGVFEIGSLLPSSWAAAQARHPVVDSALTGVLAVAVASPCTAPFMGASLGAAVALPTAQALTVFAFLGLGMALPYLAASAWPQLARLLPRPGVWMAHFKTLMAFPMFATVVWLVWVLGQQTGIDGAAALLLLLLALAFLAWALGSQTLGTVARRSLGTVAVVVMAAALFWAAPALQQEAVAAPGSTGAPGAATGDSTWQPWSAERVAQAQAEGRPVFVDFTAAWCVTCQVNKRTVLSRSEVKAVFEARRVLLLRADWTRRDPAISTELARLGRSGVPVYAVYAPGAAAPKLLSELLSSSEVREAIEALPKS